MKVVVLTSLIILVVSRLTSGLKANDPPRWEFSGQMSFNSQWYHMSSDPENPVRPRQPGDLHRAMFTPTLTYGEFRFPFRVIFSSRQTNSTTLKAPSQSFRQFIQNPVNTFSVAPSYKWAKALIGTQSVRYSSLTTGNARLFGAAVELTPGNWNLSAFHGTSQRVIQPDSLLRIPGAFQRNFTAAKLGYGKENGLHFFFNLAVMDDDQGSLTETNSKLRPKEGMAVSLTTGIPVGSYLLWKNEVAISYHTHDKRADTYTFDSAWNPFSLFYSPTIASRSDYALQSSLSYNRSMFDMDLQMKYIGDGFMAPGFPYLQTDRLDVTLSPGFRVWNNRINFSFTAGYRQNNLSNSKLQTTRQLLTGMNANIRFNENLGASARFSNFGIRTGVAQDTLRMEIISTTLSASPWVNLNVENGTHRLSASFSFDNSEDTNLMTGQQTDRQTYSAFASHTFVFNNQPMDTEFSISYLQNNGHFGMTQFTVQPGMVYRFFNNTLHSSMRLAYNQSRIMDHEADRSFMLRPGLRYTLARQWTARVDASVRMYRYGNGQNRSGFTENRLRTTISYRF